MKRSAITFAVLGSLAGLASAQSSVTVFGIVDAAARRVENEGVGTMHSLASGANNANRLGVRGSESLGGGWRASFWLEGDIGVDVGSAGSAVGQFWNRRSTVSLASDALGEIRLGRDHVTTHNATCAFDVFACVGVSHMFTLRSTQASALATATGLGSASPLSRSNNSVHYFTPNMAGFFGQFMVAAGEGAITGAIENTKAYGQRVGYNRGPLNVQLAAMQIKNTPRPGSPTFKDLVLGASYNFGLLKATLHRRDMQIQGEKLALDTASVTVSVGAAGLLKAQYIVMDQSGATPANDATLIGLGYEYNLSKRSALYGNFGQLSNKGRGTITIAGGPAVTTANFAGGTSRGYELGIRHNF